MMFPNRPSGSRIVCSYAGSGTCETVYVTEDGAHWKHDPNVPVYRSSGTAPDRVGRIVDDRIVG